MAVSKAQSTTNPARFFDLVRKVVSRHLTGPHAVQVGTPTPDVYMTDEPQEPSPAGSKLNGVTAYAERFSDWVRARQFGEATGFTGTRTAWREVCARTIWAQVPSEVAMRESDKDRLRFFSLAFPQAP